jgi:hypothetical protein
VVLEPAALRAAQVPEEEEVPEGAAPVARRRARS